MVDFDFADDIPLISDYWMVMVALVLKMEYILHILVINIRAKKSEVLFNGSVTSDVSMENFQL